MTKPTTVGHITVAYPDQQLQQVKTCALAPIPHDELCDQIAEHSPEIAAQLRGGPTTHTIIDGSSVGINGEFRQLDTDGLWYEIDSGDMYRHRLTCLYRDQQGTDVATAFRACGRCPDCHAANEHNRVRRIVQQIHTEVAAARIDMTQLERTVDRLVREITAEDEPFSQEHEDLLNELDAVKTALRHAARITQLMTLEAGDEK